MSIPKRRAAIKIVVLCLMVGVVILGFLSVKWRGQDRVIQKVEPSSRLAFVNGISFVEYHDDKKVYAVSIDSFSVERARIGPFAIGPLHVAHLNKVNMDLYLDGIESRFGKEKFGGDRGNLGRDNGKEGDLLGKNLENLIFGFRKNLPPPLKKVRGVEVREISANLWRNEQRVFRISSDTATVDRKTGDILLVGHATMDAGENGNLIAHRIRWDRKTGLFRITDPYILTKGKEKKQGNAIETDYLFKRVNDQVVGR